MSREKFNARYAEELKNAEQSGELRKDTNLQTFLTDVGRVQALKARKEMIMAELDQVKMVLRHKSLCITAGAKPQTLHPALRQTSTIEFK